MLGTCHRVRRARCRLRARRTCCSYPLARPCAVVWCCVLAGPRLSARAMLPSACLAHGGETEVETARARLSGVVPRTVSTLVSIHRHHSKRRQPKGHDLGLSRLASSARRALELKARVASEPPAPASRHGSFRDRLYLYTGYNCIQDLDNTGSSQPRASSEKGRGKWRTVRAPH